MQVNPSKLILVTNGEISIAPQALKVLVQGTEEMVWRLRILVNLTDGMGLVSNTRIRWLTTVNNFRRIKRPLLGWVMVAQGQVVVAHAFNPSTHEGRGRWISMSSRSAWSTE